MRRKDKEVTEADEIVAILDRCEMMHVGMAVDNRPYIVPMNFGYEKKDGRLFFYFHCAKEGRKIDMLRKNPHVCFEASGAYQTRTADVACKWSAEYESVMGEGVITFLETEEEKIAGLDYLMAHYGHEGKPTYSSKVMESIYVLKLEVKEISGKRT